VTAVFEQPFERGAVFVVREHEDFIAGLKLM
jgi:hypothetical protein